MLRREDNGDAGIAFVLAIPALLFVVLHLITASQQLYERREAWAVASAASRAGAQGDPLRVREENAAAIDVGRAEAAITRYASDAGYQVVNVAIDPAANTVEVEIAKQIDYIFPTLLNTRITGKSNTTLRAGVSQEGG